MEGGEQGVVGLGEGLVDGLVAEGGKQVWRRDGQDLCEWVYLGLFEDGVLGEVGFCSGCGAEGVREGEVYCFWPFDVIIPFLTTQGYLLKTKPHIFIIPLMR